MQFLFHFHKNIASAEAQESTYIFSSFQISSVYENEAIYEAHISPTICFWYILF